MVMSSDACSSSASPLKATALPFVPKTDVYLIKYPHSPFAGPIPFYKQDFALVEDIRDLLPVSRRPATEPNFLVVCRDQYLSSYQWYGLRVHRHIFRHKGGSAVREALDMTPKAHGFQFSLQHRCVVQAISTYFYTGCLSYDVATLPISEAHFLMCLYRSAVNKGFGSLADAVYSRIRRPETQLGNMHDIKAILQITIYGMIGKKAAGNKRRKEIREALIDRFGEDIWNCLCEDDLAQFCRDSRDFASTMLQAVTDILRVRMAERGIYLDEVD